MKKIVILLILTAVYTQDKKFDPTNWIPPDAIMVAHLNNADELVKGMEQTAIVRAFSDEALASFVKTLRANNEEVNKQLEGIAKFLDDVKEKAGGSFYGFGNGLFAFSVLNGKSLAYFAFDLKGNKKAEEGLEEVFKEEERGSHTINGIEFAETESNNYYGMVGSSFVIS